MNERRPAEEMREGEEPPPRGVRFMGAVRWTILAATIAVALGSWWSYAHARLAPDAGQHAPKYHCPMHPQIVSDQPGECPICHMTLEPIAQASAPASAAPLPTQRSAAASADASTPAAVGDALATTPAGLTPIVLSFDRIQAIGVRTAVATEKRTSDSLRVTAVVTPADQAITEVHVRSAGFIERIPVDQVGVAVARDQELAATYSPEVFQAQAELVTARGWSDGGTSHALDAARRKLELLGMAPGDIERVVVTGEPMRAVPIRAPAAGIVTKKTAVRGGYATPEMALYEIEDLSRLYVIAEVFQRDVAAVRVGMRARFTPRARAEASVDGVVDLIYPQVSAEARTTRVRMTVPNRKGLLHPGDYGDVELAAGARAALVVPRDAVVDTGETRYVFVAEDGGRFTPRRVEVADETSDDATIRSGLSAGERVVSGATFLIDSESRLEASMTHASHPDAGAP